MEAKNIPMNISKIKTAITKNYLHGAYNETHLEAFKAIVHPEFAIITIREDDSFFLFSRDMWEEVLKKRLQDPEFDYKKVALKPSYRTIDVEEQSACVTLDLFRDDHVIYTDFLLLKEVKGEWKIVSKIFHEHLSQV